MPGQSTGGRAGVYSSGRRADPSAPGSVPPPPPYRPSWPARGVPEAEPSWPKPGDHDPDDGWSSRAHPDDDPYRDRRGQATVSSRQSAQGRAGARPSGRVVSSASASRRGPGGGDRLPNRLWMSILAGVVAAGLVAVGVTGTLFMVHDHGSASAHSASERPKHDISSQQVDPKPLSAAEVFPATTVAPDAAGPAYTVVKSEVTDCSTAAVGDLATLMGQQGCSQAVRATLLSPDQSYVITAGIFNMKNSAGAQALNNAIDTSVNTHKGRFPGLAAGGKTDVIGTAATQIGWDSEGHFLVYCLVANASGSAIDSGDNAATKIINDMVEVDLKGTVIANRITPRASGSPNPSATS